MPRYAMVIDTSACMACYNCFVACRDEHCGFDTTVSKAQPHAGHTWIRIDETERGDDKRLVKTSSIATPCLHCEDPACQKVATSDAIYKRPDGIVIIDPDKAKGQTQIIDACPIGAIYWNDKLEIPQKCTLCAHLLDEGYKEPRCAEACPNGAIHFGDLDDPDSEIAKELNAGKLTALTGMEGVACSVVHLNIHSVFVGGSVYSADDEAIEDALVTLTDKANGEIRTTYTNYFGDFEFDDLTKDGDYEIRIECEAYESKLLDAKADTDHYLGEIILKKE